MKKIFMSLLCLGLLFGCSETSEPEEKQAKNERQDLEIVKSGYSLSSEDMPYIMYGIELKNPNTSYSVEFPNVKITAYGKDGNVLATSDQTFNTIAPGETIYWGSQADCAEQVPDKVTFEVTNLEEDYLETEDPSSSKDLEITQKNVNSDEFSTNFTGKVKNNGLEDISSVNISVILYKDDQIVFGTGGYVDNLAAGKELPFEVSEYSDIPEYDTYEVYALNWSFN